MGKDHYWQRSAERERKNKYNKIMTREGKRKKKLNSFSICVSTNVPFQIRNGIVHLGKTFWHLEHLM